MKPQEVIFASANSRIQWSEDEWDALTKQVWMMRKNIPEDTLVELARRASEQFPVHRRRNLRVVNELKPMLERLTKMDEHLLDQAEMVQSLQDKLKQLKEPPPQLSREDILNDLSDEEVIVRYGDRVLALLTPNELIKQIPKESLIEQIPVPQMAAHLFQKAMEILTEKSEKFTEVMDELSASVKSKQVHQSQQLSRPSVPSIPTPKNNVVFVKPEKLPKVTVIGLLSNQQQAIRQKLKSKAEFYFVDKNRKNDVGPENQDVIIVAVDFVNHSSIEQAKKKIGNGKLILHHGGISNIIKKLEDVLSKKEAV